MPPSTRRGNTMIGLLITMACILVLSVILMNAMNKATTGEGNARAGTVRSMEDQLHLYAIFQGLAVYATGNRDAYPVPSRISRTDDITLDTTANLFSAMIAERVITPELLIAGNEFGYAEVDADYDYLAYQPQQGVYWDPDFSADLNDTSNVSYAHMPLYGKRFGRYWSHTLGGSMPLIGNRGPRDGYDDPQSFSYGRAGVWGGHVLFSDGAIEFIETFTPSRVARQENGASAPDNIFAMEEGPGGGDAMLGFTIRMTEDGPEFVWD